VGVDYQHSWGSFYARLDSRGSGYFEPDFRAGVFVAPGLALGGWLTLFDAFPESTSIFTHMPMFAFGPMVGYFAILPEQRVIPYVMLNAGFSALGGNWYSHRVGLLAGADWRLTTAIGLGIVAGWFFDQFRYETASASGNTVFAGLRFTGIVQQ
jgi:hypothetical protein